MSNPRQKVLVTGASGFLGWHIANALVEEYDVAITYGTHPIEFPKAKVFPLSLEQEKTVAHLYCTFQPDAVVHCAAIASGAMCESDPDLARKVNVDGTGHLVDQMPHEEGLFIYISTDLVFDGQNPPYSEEDPLCPVSIYGQTKSEGEEIVLQHASSYAILRAALMFGPPTGAGKGSFLQWMDRTFHQDSKAKLFHDEYRTPVFVLDIVQAIKKLLTLDSCQKIYHLGGPERVSRVAFGENVTKIRGYSNDLIQPVSLKEMDTGYPRPADVSLVSDKIQHDLQLTLTPIEEALRQSFHS